MMMGPVLVSRFECFQIIIPKSFVQTFFNSRATSWDQFVGKYNTLPYLKDGFFKFFCC